MPLLSRRVHTIPLNSKNSCYDKNSFCLVVSILNFLILWKKLSSCYLWPLGRRAGSHIAASKTGLIHFAKTDSKDMSHLSPGSHSDITQSHHVRLHACHATATLASKISIYSLEINPYQVTFHILLTRKRTLRRYKQFTFRANSNKWN